MRSCVFGTVVLCLGLSTVAGCGLVGAEAKNDGGKTGARAKSGPKGKSRTFRFVYGATIDGLEPGARARVWLPLAVSDTYQDVERTKTDVPGEVRETTEGGFGNRLLYFEAEANEQGEIPIDVHYDVTRREAVPGGGAKVSEAEKLKFLAPASMVPAEFGYVGAVLRGAKLPEARKDQARVFYDGLLKHMNYDKPEGGEWGRGDAKWACSSKHGNCTDFHSVFNGMCRETTIPAKFEIGFPIPADASEGEVGGYHCWAWFAVDNKWHAVDVSEADKHPDMQDYYFGHLTPDRVTFTTGRDLTLDPPQDGPPVNYLVYPYVEVDGKPHGKFTKRFRFESLK